MGQLSLNIFKYLMTAVPFDKPIGVVDCTSFTLGLNSDKIWAIDNVSSVSSLSWILKVICASIFVCVSISQSSKYE